MLLTSGNRIAPHTRLPGWLIAVGVLLATQHITTAFATETGALMALPPIEYTLESRIRESISTSIAAPVVPLKKAVRVWRRVLAPDVKVDLNYTRRPDGLVEISTFSLFAGGAETRVCISINGLLDLICQASNVRGLDYAQQSADGKPAKLGAESTLRVEQLSVTGSLLPTKVGDEFSLEAKVTAKTIRTDKNGSKVEDRDYVARKTCTVVQEKTASEIAQALRGQALIVRCNESESAGSRATPQITMLRAFLRDSLIFITLEIESPSKISTSWLDIEYQK